MRKNAWMSSLVVGAAASFVMAACGSSSKGASKGATATTASGPSASAAPTPKYPPIPAGPIKFGISVPLSGAQAVYGIPPKMAFEQVTLSTFNAAHPDGIDGHPIQFDILDDASDVTKAVQVATQFSADKVAAVVTATYNPQAAPQQLATLNKEKIPVLAQQGDDSYTDTSKWPYFFGMGASNQQVGEAAAKYIAGHPAIQKVSVLSDNSPGEVQIQTGMANALKTSAPNVVTKTVTIVPGAVDVSTAVAQLKASNPDLLVILVSFGYAAIWQGINGAGWNPNIMVGAGAFYDAFTGMGNLVNNAVVITTHCTTPGHPPFPKALTDPMDGYVRVFGTTSVNYILYDTSNNGPLELLKQAIEKNHSIDPDAIKQGLESLGNVSLFGLIDYNFTSTNHFGLNGAYGTNVCKMTGFSDGKYRVPVIAS
jgi:ABC-type branched-subunit amino acid transport system substrate-binding protein